MVVKWFAAVPLALLVLATPAQALYEDLTFTTLFNDPQDNVGFLDIRDVSIAETGLQEIVLRYGIDTTLPAQATVSQALFFTAGGTDWSTGVTATGAPAGNGNWDRPAVKSCTFDGGKAYCAIDYASLGVVVGDAITATSGISYAGVAQDYAPAQGPWIPHGLLGAKGADYTLVGCTRVADCPTTATAPAGPVYGNLTTPSLTYGVNVATTGTFVFNFTTALSNATLAYAVNGTGNLTMQVLDGAGALQVNQTFDSPVSGQANVTGAAPGNWTYTLVLQDFNGTLSLDLLAPAANVTTSGSTTGTSTTGTATASSQEAGHDEHTDGTDDDTADVPGFGLLSVVLALALIIARRR